MASTGGIRAASQGGLVRTTAVYAACHLVVDLACIATLLGVSVPALGLIGPYAKASAIIVYDMLAFCLQLPIGALLDMVGRRRSRVAAILSLLLTMAGVLVPWLPGFVGIQMSVSMCAGVSVLLVALGNALFHCVGGVEVLGESDGLAEPAGAFIATGAIGVFVGSMDALGSWVGTPLLLTALLVMCMGCVLWLGRASDQRGLSFASLTGAGWLAVALLAATVALRSYTGMVMAFPWKEGLVMGVCVVAAVVAGKALGGFVADRIGFVLASILSLGGAAAAFWYSWDSVALGLVGVFLFNFTMAITLCALVHLMPTSLGLAFGIASFSLAVGALPALLGLHVTSAQALTALSAASLVTLLLGLLFLRIALRGSGGR